MRAFRLVPDTALAAIREAAVQLLGQWSGDWGAPLDDLQIDACRLDSAGLLVPADDWQALGGGWMFKSGDLTSQVASAMGLPAVSTTPSTMSSQTVAQAADDLSIRIAGLLRDATPPPQASGLSQALQAPGHGIVRITLSRGTQVLSLAAEAAAFKAWTPPVHKSPPIRSDRSDDLDAALRTQIASLEVVLGHTELSLADMMDLGPGDVLLLDRRIDQPLLLGAIDGQAELPVHLGRQGDRFAVQLMGPNHADFA